MRAFISYSHRDEQRLQRLKTHLSVLRRDGQIEHWFDREILAGAEIDSEINAQLARCDLFLLLVSPDFLASDYCYEREMAIALERHRANEAQVVPVILEPCDWRNTVLGGLKAVPHDGHPIARWANENDAFLDVVQELRRIIHVHTEHQSSTREGPRQAGTHPAPASTGLEPQVLGSLSGVDPRHDRDIPQHHESWDPADTRERERTGEGHRSRGYRIQRDFDEIDYAQFREEAFTVIQEHFRREVAELTSQGWSYPASVDR